MAGEANGREVAVFSRVRIPANVKTETNARSHIR